MGIWSPEILLRLKNLEWQSMWYLQWTEWHWAQASLLLLLVLSVIVLQIFHAHIYSP